MKKLEPISKRSMEASLQRKFCKNLTLVAAPPAPASGGAEKNTVQNPEFESAGRQKFISPIPPFLFACPPKRAPLKAGKAAFFGAELFFIPPLVPFPRNFRSIYLQYHSIFLELFSEFLYQF